MRICFFLLLICLYSCKGGFEEDYEVITLRNSFDFTVEKGKPNYKDSLDVQVVTDGELKLFIIPMRHTTINQSIKETNGKKKVTNFVTYSYNFIEKGKEFGLRYDSLSAESGKRIKADSILTSLNIAPRDQEQNSDVSGKLVHSLYNKENGTLVEEKYAGTQKGLDSLYRFFDYSMKDVNFSLSPELDKKYGTKLVRITFLNNAKDTDSIKTNKDVISCQIMRGKLSNPKEIKLLMDRYHKQKAGSK